jgi:FHS family L-fucose permease-like MFS transporter
MKSPVVGPVGADASRQLFILSIGVFFIGGFLTAVVSLLVPRFKALFGLGYAQALLIQFASHASYLMFALPITFVIMRSGYMRSIATGLAVMAVACLAFVAANDRHIFGLVLAALLLLSLGITFLQIAANTVVTIVVPAKGAAARLTLLQGFNALGTVLGPVVAAPLMLAGAGGAVPDDAAVGLPFAVGAVVLAGLALAFVLRRNLLERGAERRPDFGELRVLRHDRRLLAGTAAIFAYVGAEVTIGSLLTNYLMRGDILGMSAVGAGRMVSLYWGGAMIGRFAGAAVMRRHAPATVLTTVAATATGALAAAALIAVGLCNSVMYPTIYALALPADHRLAPLASMLLCMAVVGGAVVPLVTGVVADAAGLGSALLVPALCYVGIAAFGRTARA